MNYFEAYDDGGYVLIVRHFYDVKYIISHHKSDDDIGIIVIKTT
jgi:hypothetical protein